MTQREVPQMFRPSARQRHLWTSSTAGAAPRVQRGVLVDGALEPERVRRALAEVVLRHPALRTEFVHRPGMRVPYQAIADDAELGWRVIEAPTDGGGDEAAVAAVAAVAAAAEEARRATPRLDEPAPLDAVLVRLGPDHHALLLSAPALVADAESLDVVLGETWALLAGEELSPAEEIVSYLEFSEWQLEQLDTGEAEAGMELWRRARERRRPAPLPGETVGGDPFDPTAVPVPLDDETRAGLAAAGAEAAERFLLACWTVLLARLTDQPEVASRVLAAGRPFEEVLGAVGPFATPLPSVVRVEPGFGFEEHLERVGRALDDALEHQDVPPDVHDGADDGTGSGPLFEFRRSTLAPRRAGSLAVRPVYEWAAVEPFTVFLRAVTVPDAGLDVSLLFDRARLSLPAGECLTEQLAGLCRDAWRHRHRPVGDLDLLGDRLRRFVVEGLHGNRPDGPLRAEALPERFAATARRHPERIAVVVGGEEITYRELDRRAEALGRRLRREGVGPDVPVGLLLPRSVDFVVAILGAWKAGGAYLPLDPDLPAPRRAAMIEDAAPAVLIHRGEHPAAAGFDGPTVDLAVPDSDAADTAATAGDDGAPDAPRHPRATEPSSLAYVLFTSGSTGRPKGVAVEHRQIAAYVEGAIAALALEEGWTYAAVSTLAADLGLTVVLPSLVLGGRLVLATEAEGSDPAALGRLLAARDVDCMKIVPSHLEALLAAPEPQRLCPRRLLVLGGEAAGRDLVERARSLVDGLRVVNHYGPTETTVGATFRPLDAAEDGPPALGCALPQAEVHAVDVRLHPVAPGSRGELVVGGAGVARGYVGRVRETAERFVPDPFGTTPGGRLYRTGDLARLDDVPELHFVGRVDHQVKVRGHRVELGEVEAVLARRDEVWGVAAVVREGRLVAFVVPHRGRRIGPETVLVELAAELPEAMVPARVVPLDALPLTGNGKLDRRALETLELAAPRSDAEPVAPRDEVEATLAGIWAEVLRLERVGVEDNFFQLGGDSIQSIQIVARAAQAGLGLEPRQLFEHQTVARLAQVAERRGASRVDQGPVTGPAALTPIQHRFFAADLVHPERFNQAVLVELTRPVPADRLATALGRLADHHDALRGRFGLRDDGWTQTVTAPGGTPAVTVVDLAALPAEARRSAVSAAADAAQGALDLSRGPLVRAVLTDVGPDGRRDRRYLALVIHHLVVDGVSWRVLLEDLDHLLRAPDGPATAPLPPKTVSLAAWAVALEAAAGSPEVVRQRDHWRRVATEIVPAPGGDTGRVGESASHQVSLDAGETATLLRVVPRRLDLAAGEVLVAAVAVALGRWRDRDRVDLDLEGHGRDAVPDPPDVSRTVGWFTTRYPAVFDLRRDGTVSERLRHAASQASAVPAGGAGYGLLRHLAPAQTDDLATAPTPAVSFNYLGQLDQVFPEGSLFRPAGLSAGATRHPDQRRWHRLEIVAMVVGDRLVIDLGHVPRLDPVDAVATFGELVVDTVRQLLAGLGEVETELESESEIDSEVGAEELDLVLDSIEFEL